MSQWNVGGWILLLVAGCAGPLDGSGGRTDDGSPGWVLACTTDGDCLEGDVCHLGRAGLGVCQQQGDDQSSLDPDGNDDSIDDDPSPVGLPCELDTVIATHCRHCHNTMPTFGAPMALVSYEDMQRHADGSLDRVLDVQRPMPPPPLPGMSDFEIVVLADWVGAGMPTGTVCDTPPQVRDPMDLVPDGPEEDCEFELDITAHGLDGAVDAPFPVPPETDIYVCYTYRMPWQGRVHGLSFRPIVDDARVLHHWLMYEGGDERDIGHPRQCNGQHQGAALVAGWAPGGSVAAMPPDVGLELPDGPGALLTLEVHYHNEAGYADALDRSGVRVCATSDLRPNAAAVHWLGTESIFSFARGRQDFTGTCTPQISEPMNILLSSPHMHKRGAHMTSVVRRRDGSLDTLIDKPFDFDNQIIYDTPLTLYPGDVIDTTCTFDNPNGLYHFGPRTQDEMCYNFVTAWPVGGMESGGSLVGAKHACLR